MAPPTTPVPAMLVLYGSQSGTAQDYAEALARALLRSGHQCRLSAMDDYPIEQFVTERLVLLVCSTTGQGNEPDNMRRFWRFLLQRRLNDTNCLLGLCFAVFGLGDSSYLRYNVVAKRLQKRLEQLGAAAIIPRGDGDDQDPQGPDLAFQSWQDQLLRAIRAISPATGPVLTDDALLPPKIKIVLLDPSSPPFHQPVPAGTRQSQGTPMRLVRNERITAADHFQDVRHFALQPIDPSPVPSFAPSDAVLVFPHNLDHNIQAMVDLMHWQLDQVVSLQPNPLRPDGWLPLPLIGQPVSLRTLLREWLNFLAIPTRSFFSLIAHFAASQQHREKLHELGSPAGYDLFLEYCYRPRRTILEVLQDFASVRIPLERISDAFPWMRGRYFSIASASTSTSASASHPRLIELTVAIVQYRHRDIRAEREGICSRWLSRLPVGSIVPISIHPGTLRLPARQTCFVPLLLLCAGTGIAPMRSIIHHFLADPASPYRQTIYLLFGCRRVSSDCLYRQEWEQLAAATGRLVFQARGSRDQPGPKHYLQDTVRDQGALVWRLIDTEGALVLVSGNSKLPSAVRGALAEVARTHLGGDPAAYLEELERSDRLQYESW